MPSKSPSNSSGRGAKPSHEGVVEHMEFGLDVPPDPSDLRPGAGVSLEMVNIFGEPVAESSGKGVRLRLTAWVNNVTYVKHVWVDAYLIDPGGDVVHAESLVLNYYEGAGGGGDFFGLDAPIPGTGGRAAASRLVYRLYYQIGDTVYTDGLPHEHVLSPAASRAARAPAPAGARGQATGVSQPSPPPDKPAAGKARAAKGAAADGEKAPPAPPAPRTAARRKPAT